jgi:hypothetical protein
VAKSAKVVVMVDGLDIHYLERLGKRRCWSGVKVVKMVKAGKSVEVE